MKTLKDFINEALNFNLSMKPRSKEELKKIVGKLINQRGYEADLNDIDTSNVKDMSFLFEDSKFNGNISKWDVSNVLNMRGMFTKSKFNGDISKWDVSNVENMSGMFADSEFEGDLSEWNVSKVKTMSLMFCKSKFTGKNTDLSWWDVSRVQDMRNMFKDSKFNGNISKWNVRAIEYMHGMFDNCPIKDAHKPKFKNIEEKLVLSNNSKIIGKSERTRIPDRLPQRDLGAIDKIYHAALEYAKEHNYDYDNGLDKIQEYIDKHLDDKYKTKEWIWGYIAITLGYDYFYDEDEDEYLASEWEDQDPVNELAVRVSEDVNL